MQKVTKTIISIIITYSLLLAAYSSNISLAKKYNFPTTTSIVHDQDTGIILIRPSSRELTFDPYGTTAQNLGFQRNAAIVINAGYFGYDRHNPSIFVPAGIYTLDNPPHQDVIIDPSHCARDSNLCSFFDTTSLGIHRRNDVLRGSIINSGPILLKDGIINPDIYAHNSHRDRPTFRTILINTSSGPLFLLTTKPYTLPAITHKIKNVIGPTTTAINLDGGSSTSIRTSQSDIYFNDSKRLPTYFLMW